MKSSKVARGRSWRKPILGMLAFSMVASVATVALAAGDLVTGGTVTKVTVRNTSPAEAFSIEISGGEGPCADGVIRFPSSGSASVDDGMRSIAVAAFLSGKKVRAYDYGSGTNCDAADYIRIEN